jgi:hypothetical protein
MPIRCTPVRDTPMRYTSAAGMHLVGAHLRACSGLGAASHLTNANDRIYLLRVIPQGTSRPDSTNRQALEQRFWEKALSVTLPYHNISD